MLRLLAAIRDRGYVAREELEHAGLELLVAHVLRAQDPAFDHLQTEHVPGVRVDGLDLTLGEESLQQDDSVLSIGITVASGNRHVRHSLQDGIAETGLAEAVAVVEHVLSALVLEDVGIFHHLGVPAGSRTLDADLLVPSRPGHAISRLRVPEPVALAAVGAV